MVVFSRVIMTEKHLMRHSMHFASPEIEQTMNTCTLFFFLSFCNENLYVCTSIRW